MTEDQMATSTSRDMSHGRGNQTLWEIVFQVLLSSKCGACFPMSWLPQDLQTSGDKWEALWLERPVNHAG